MFPVSSGPRQPVSTGARMAQAPLGAVLSEDTRPPRVNLGLLTYCFSIAAKACAEVPGVPNYAVPAVFIREAARIGANAVQIPFGVLDAEAVRTIRALAENLGIALESTLAIPEEGEMHKFEAETRTLRELGVTVVRTVVFPGRRYEDYDSPAALAAALGRAKAKLRRAEPIARKHQVRLAVENHKDQRTEERVLLLEEFSSENVGACIDVGNNIALLEDPVAVVRALLPWALTVHFKDQGVRMSDDGFLLADVPLGEGSIDLPKVLQTIRGAKPNIRLHLELITRDPLRVPVLAESYWRTFPQLEAAHLAETWSMIKQRGARQPFPIISSLPIAEKVAAERRNIEKSFRFAAANLSLSI